MRSKTEANHRLQTISEAQAGFFTAKQAQIAGFSPSSHTYHVREGDWVREYRGIYRLKAFPAVLRPELVRWHLWSMDRAGRALGVYSHFTALDLHLTPSHPTQAKASLEWATKLYMTVPMGFRRSGPIPEGLDLRYADLPASDIAARNGYRLTTPLRTFLDLAHLANSGQAAANAMSRAELSKALMEIAERKLITRAQIKSARIPEASRLQFEAMLVRKKR